MRVLVHGAGAVGGYFGARLAIGGHDVTFVARGENLAALRRQGLTLRLSTGEALRVVPAHAVGDPAEAPPPELVLVTVKSYDTPAAAAALRPAVGPETAILSLQNGIENEDILARALGLPPPHGRPHADRRRAGRARGRRLQRSGNDPVRRAGRPRDAAGASRRGG